MKNMLLLLLLLHSISSFAQNDFGTPEERAEKMTGEMHKAMCLSKNQKDSIHVLNLKYARRIQQEVIDTELNTWQQYRQAKKINRSKEKELLPLLTTEQRTAYETLKEAKTKEMWKRIF